MSMMDFIKINGTAVRLTSFYQRAIPQDDGPPLKEVELVILLRGTMANRSFLALLGRDQVRLEIPDPSASGWTICDTELVSSYQSSSDAGEAAAHRHDVTLRETPASAERRAAEQAAQQPPPCHRTPLHPRQPHQHRRSMKTRTLRSISPRSRSAATRASGKQRSAR